MHEQRSPERSGDIARLDGAILGLLASLSKRLRRPGSATPEAMDPAAPTYFPSKEFGQTPPPEDGSLASCPTCVSGWRRIGLIHRIACPDCLGSGVQGYGSGAVRVFEEYVEGVPADDDEAGGGGDGAGEG
jgi:hypothetical protein